MVKNLYMNKCYKGYVDIVKHIDKHGKEQTIWHGHQLLL